MISASMICGTRLQALQFNLADHCSWSARSWDTSRPVLLKDMPTSTMNLFSQQRSLPPGGSSSPLTVPRRPLQLVRQQPVQQRELGTVVAIGAASAHPDSEKFRAA
jgi:hypothetical protein